MNKFVKIKQICQEYDITLAYLFGSKVKEGLKILNNEIIEINDPLSDLDFGLVFKNEGSTKKSYKLYSELYNLFSDIFLPLKLDLVFLQENHSVFQSQAFLGECIYYDDEEFKDNYEDRILARAADFKYVLDKYYEERMEEMI